MYRGSISLSLLPKFSTDYVVHKEAVSQLFIDGVGNFLFDMKKETFPSLPFCIGSYKFTKVKGASKFVKDLEKFHFEEKSFHINDSMGKVVDHCTSVGVRYEYTHYFYRDDEVYRKASNITDLSKRFKKKSNTSGGKGSNNTTEKQKEEILKKHQEEAEKKQEE